MGDGQGEATCKGDYGECRSNRITRYTIYFPDGPWEVDLCGRHDRPLRGLKPYMSRPGQSPQIPAGASRGRPSDEVVYDRKDIPDLA